MAQSTDQFGSVRNQIHQYLQQKSVPSISVAVVQDGQILWEESFGWADRENQIKATPHTPYTLASLSKPITVTAIMLLHQRGLLDLDAPINNYLKGARISALLGATSAVTARRIAQHTSGLPNHYETFYPDEEAEPPTTDFMIKHYGSTMIPQGRFHYSNLGYTLLGYVISRISGHSFADFVRQELFLPLGMSNSFVQEGTEVPQHHAIRYKEDGTRLPDYETPHAPASDVYSSVHDLVRFATFHMNTRLPDQPQLLSERIIAEMQQQTVPIPTWKYQYGLGWSVGTDRKGRRHVFHGGGGSGVDSLFVMIPEKKLAVVVLTNVTRGGPGTVVSDDILNATLAAVLDEPQEDVQLDFSQRTYEKSGLPGKLLGEWRGTVHTRKQDIQVTFWFKESGEVHAQLENQLEMLVNEALYVEGIFLGRILGDIGTEEASRRRYYLDWDLTLVDGNLCGVLYAGGHEEDRGLLLAHSVQLERVARTE